MGHINKRGNFLPPAGFAERREKFFPRSRVHAGTGLVENNQIRFGHARPRNQNFLLLALRQGAEGLFAQLKTAEFFKIAPRARVIVTTRFTPRSEEHTSEL